VLRAHCCLLVADLARNRALAAAGGVMNPVKQIEPLKSPSQTFSAAKSRFRASDRPTEHDPFLACPVSLAGTGWGQGRVGDHTPGTQRILLLFRVVALSSVSLQGIFHTLA
jgi:hypothetical protein